MHENEDLMIQTFTNTSKRKWHEVKGSTIAELGLSKAKSPLSDRAAFLTNKKQHRENDSMRQLKMD